MKFECEKTLLASAIEGVSRAITNRSAIPVLEGVYLKAEGFNLTLTGYDMELGIVTTIEANVLEAGDIVLNAKLLNDMVRRMPAGQISISVADNGKTTIQGGVAQFEIQSMPAADFPQLPNTGAEDTLTIQTGVFRDMIERTLYAVSQDDKKPAHTGELLEIFRFKSEEEAVALMSGSRGEDVRDELADVVYFVLRFADVTGIDISEALVRKLEKNAVRYPAEKVRGDNRKYEEY